MCLLRTTLAFLTLIDVTYSEYSLCWNIIPPNFMTSVRSFFLYFPLTSDEIKNVVRLSPRRNGKSTMSPVQFPARFLLCLRKHHIGSEPSPGRDKKRPYPSVSREHDDEYFSYRHTPPNHLGFPSHPPERGERSYWSREKLSRGSSKLVEASSTWRSSTATPWLIHYCRKIIVRSE